MTSPQVLWSAGTATGVGSLPGEDIAEALRSTLDTVPIPYLPELPARGWHADLAGRGAALMADLYVDVQPTGWRITPRPSRVGQRAKDELKRDLDALEDLTQDNPPELFKLQGTGVWTLASLLELHRGSKLLSDPGAVIDLAASLAEGLAGHLADVQRRLPTTKLVLQLDEPALPGVLNARIRTASGFATLRAPDPQTVRERLRTVLGAAERTVIHCCAPHPPIELMAEAGAISIDAAMIDAHDHEALGVVLEQGTGLLLGVVPTSGRLPAVNKIRETVGRLRDRVGMTDVTLTPACGLAGSTQEHAKAVMGRCVEAAEAQR